MNRNIPRRAAQIVPLPYPLPQHIVNKLRRFNITLIVRRRPSEPAT
jgi:hypothetical protein